MVGVCRIVLCLTLTLFAGPCSAVTIWNEYDHVDAGNNPVGAQTIVGSGPLTRILGRLNAPGDNSNWVDLYRFLIVDPQNFSATTDGGIPDPQLFLFNADGYGVKGNDDHDTNTKESYLSGFPGAPGVYYLWISATNRDPNSAAGPIFPEPGKKGVGVMVDPVPGAGILTGPNGGSISFPISQCASCAYTIDLEGAEPIPEPSTVAQALIGLALLSASRFRRRRG